MKKKNLAVYPGSFDPITNGHLDIIRRAVKVFDELIIAVAVNIEKNPLFTLKERMEMVRGALDEFDGRIRVEAFDGLLVQYIEKVNARAIIRGLRAVSDFEYEMQMANMNRKLYPDVETLFMMTGEESFYVSSRIVKEVALFGGKYETLVPKNVARCLKNKFAKQNK
ncbi:MAG: pantetheine-phosphate adenylyltransferase [Myxococcota bacterium]